MITVGTRLLASGSAPAKSASHFSGTALKPVGFPCQTNGTARACKAWSGRMSRGRGGEMPELREAIVADLAGHGKNDLAIIVHDRILVYPQD